MSEDGDGNPLKNLLVDKEKVNRKRLSEGLNGKIEIAEQDGSPIFRQGFTNSSDKDKIVLYLLYRKANCLIKQTGSNKEKIDLDTLSSEIGVSTNTITTNISRETYLKKDEDGCWIPNHSVEEAINSVN